MRWPTASSSRMRGTLKSSGVCGPPRSRQTTVMPASENSLPRMPPVQPPPTSTTSTSLYVFMSALSAQVGDADGLGPVRLVFKLDDVDLVGCVDAGIAEHFPAGLAPVAAIDRVGEHRF